MTQYTKCNSCNFELSELWVFCPQCGEERSDGE